MSDSDSEGNLVVDDGGSAVDDSICPICRGTTYIGETINCEKCEYWFHFECVGVTHDDPWVKNEDVPYFCVKCGGVKPKRTPAKRARSKPAKASTPKAQQNSPAPVKSLPTSPPIKLKISLGRKKTSSRTIELSPPRQIPNKRKPIVDELPPKDEEIKQDSKDSSPASKRRKRIKSEDEEEKWLDAVESGNLHAVDAELKSIRDPKLMTARQRAMVDRKNNDDFNDEGSGHISLAYISAKKTKSAHEEEENQKIKAMKSAKRKEIELEKREQDRIKTIDKLLNKQESSTLKTAVKNSFVSQPAPASQGTKYEKITYIHRKEGPLLSFPPSMKIPIATKKPIEAPQPIICSIEACKNVKKYNCSKSDRPLCSLSCYKKNLLLI